MKEAHSSEQSLDDPPLERRKYPRYRFDAAMKFNWGATERAARVRVIGQGGMEVELANPLWVGARFSAELAVDPPVRLACEVRYLVPGHSMGLSVAVPEETDRQRFKALLSQLADARPFKDFEP